MTNETCNNLKWATITENVELTENTKDNLKHEFNIFKVTPVRNYKGPLFSLKWSYKRPFYFKNKKVSALRVRKYKA